VRTAATVRRPLARTTMRAEGPRRRRSYLTVADPDGHEPLVRRRPAAEWVAAAARTGAGKEERETVRLAAEPRTRRRTRSSTTRSTQVSAAVGLAVGPVRSLTQDRAASWHVSAAPRNRRRGCRPAERTPEAEAAPHRTGRRSSTRSFVARRHRVRWDAGNACRRTSLVHWSPSLVHAVPGGSTVQAASGRQRPCSRRRRPRRPRRRRSHSASVQLAAAVTFGGVAVVAASPDPAPAHDVSTAPMSQIGPTGRDAALIRRPHAVPPLPGAEFAALIAGSWSRGVRLGGAAVRLQRPGARRQESPAAHDRAVAGRREQVVTLGDQLTRTPRCRNTLLRRRPVRPRSPRPKTMNTCRLRRHRACRRCSA
jgi:hypothetical protein